MVARRRRNLHRLVDQLPDDQVEPAIRLLRGLEAGADPLLRLVRAAPLDDEELSADDLVALDEARADVAAGRVLSHEQVVRGRLSPGGDR